MSWSILSGSTGLSEFQGQNCLQIVLPYYGHKLLLHFTVCTTKEITQHGSENKITSKLRLPVYPELQMVVKKAASLYSSADNHSTDCDYGQDLVVEGSK